MQLKFFSRGPAWLTARDTEAFVKALLKPPVPSKKLKRAAERYKKFMGD